MISFPERNQSLVSAFLEKLVKVEKALQYAKACNGKPNERDAVKVTTDDLFVYLRISHTAYMAMLEVEVSYLKDELKLLGVVGLD